MLFASPDEEWAPTDYAAKRRLWDEWSLLGFVVGPPLLAPGSLALVGGMGLAAAVLRRER